MVSATPAMLRVAVRLVVAVLLAVGALTISSGDAGAVVLEGDNDHGILAVSSSGTSYIRSTNRAAPVAVAASLPGARPATGGPQEF